MGACQLLSELSVVFLLWAQGVKLEMFAHARFRPQKLEALSPWRGRAFLAAHG